MSPGNLESAQELQRRYYEATAGRYDNMHVSDADEHTVALHHIVMHVKALGIRSVLDTGCGTGRAMCYLMTHLPETEVRGNDTSEAMLAMARERNGLPPHLLDVASSEKLPYPDGSFDAVMALGVMHHVPRPDIVVSEMLRVARRVVFISDGNIYGHGRLPIRLLKLGLSRIRLLATVNRIRRGGHEWFYSDGDGIAYSYSVFHDLPTIRRVCSQVILTTTGGSDKFPLLTAHHVLVCGFKG